MDPIQWLKKFTGELSDQQFRVVVSYHNKKKFVGAAKLGEKWFPLVDIGHKNAAVLRTGLIDSLGTMYISERKYF